MWKKLIDFNTLQSKLGDDAQIIRLKRFYVCLTFLCRACDFKIPIFMWCNHALIVSVKMSKKHSSYLRWNLSKLYFSYSKYAFRGQILKKRICFFLDFGVNHQKNKVSNDKPMELEWNLVEYLNQVGTVTVLKCAFFRVK